MVSLDVLLLAENQWNGLIYHCIVKQQHILFFIADRACAALAEIDRTAEQLKPVFTQYAGRVHAALRLFAGVICHKIHIEMLICPNKITDIRRQCTALSLQRSPASKVCVLSAKHQLYCLHTCVFAALCTNVIVECKSVSKPLHLDQMQHCIFFRIHLRLDCRHAITFGLC